MQHKQFKKLSILQMKALVGGGGAGCRTDYCTKTQGCCPGLICALLPIAGTDIRGTCFAFDFDGN